MGNKTFHLMCKPTSYECNLKCDYCFYLEKEKMYKENKDQLRMSDKVLQEYIKQYIDSQDSSVVEFAWQGGEPTLCGLPYFERIIQYQKQYAQGKKICNTLQTNGVLINKKWCDFFIKNDFLIGISIDGLIHHHNKYRLTTSNKGSFDKVKSTIELFNKMKVEYNTLTVINNNNVNDAVIIYKFLKSIGSKFHQYIPIIESSELRFKDNEVITKFIPCGKKILPFSVSRTGYGKFMINIFDEWIKKDVGNIYIQLFDATLISLAGYPASMCTFSKECGQALIIERNGDIYPCDHYVYPEFKMGNIMNSDIQTIFNSAKQVEFGLAKSHLSIKCKACKFLFICNGGCIKHRIDKLKNGDAQNYLCESYYNYFSHVKIYMDYMLNELNHNRDVSSVMSFAAKSYKM